MCKLTERCFARYLACALVVQNVNEVVIDLGFHLRFVKAFREMSEQLSDYWKPTFEIGLCSHSDRGSDDVENMVREIGSTQGLVCSVQSIKRQLCLNPKRNKNRAQSSLKGLPRKVRALFKKMSSDLVVNKKLP